MKLRSLQFSRDTVSKSSYRCAVLTPKGSEIPVCPHFDRMFTYFSIKSWFFGFSMKWLTVQSMKNVEMPNLKLLNKVVTSFRLIDGGTFRGSGGLFSPKCAIWILLAGIHNQKANFQRWAKESCSPGPNRY